jgi:hypothetical protein
VLQLRRRQWHVVALNTNGSGAYATISCSEDRSRSGRSADFAQSAPCGPHVLPPPAVLDGPHGDNAGVRRLWQTLYDLGADVILQGDDHNYQG